MIDNSNKFYRDIENELIKAIELGYSIRYPKVAANANFYYTTWENRPAPRAFSIVIDDETFSANINGMGAIHAGAEFDAAYNLTKKLTLEGIISLGDWKWNAEDTVRFTDNNGDPVLNENGNQVTSYFNAKGVHVGNAAQTQLGGSIKYEPFKGFYLKSRITYFGKNFANFDPLSLDGSANSMDEDGKPRDSWQMPNYYTIDLHAGYSFYYHGSGVSIRASVLNLTNQLYISDANNNDQFAQSYNDFDAKSATVFFGLPRRFNISMKVSF